MNNHILKLLENKKTPYWLKIKDIISKYKDNINSSKQVLYILRENGIKLSRDDPNKYHSETMKYIEKIFNNKRHKSSKKCLIVSSDSESESEDFSDTESFSEIDTTTSISNNVKESILSDTDTEDNYRLEEEETYYTINQINSNIKFLLENKFRVPIYVEAEISNMSIHKGNTYLYLKDRQSKIKGVIWRKQYSNIKDGDKVKIKGKLTSYIPNGEYQIIVYDLQPLGNGELMKSYKIKKEKLEKLGYFNNKKKIIKNYNQSIAIISSHKAAGFGDMIHRIRSKNQWMKIYLFSSSLQGKSCSKEIIQNINKINKLNYIDLILIGRGGGSKDDLDEYDDENLVKSIYNSKIPIVTAIGHQKDRSLADMTSDKSYITPTEASDNITTDTIELKIKLDNLKLKLIENIKSKINNLINKYLEINEILHKKITNYFKIIKDKLKKNIILKIDNYTSILNKKQISLNYNHLISDLILFKQKLRDTIVKKININYDKLIQISKKYLAYFPSKEKIVITSDKNILNSEDDILSHLKNNKYFYLYLNKHKKIKILIKDFSIENIS